MERYEKPEMEVILFNEEEIRTANRDPVTESMNVTPTPGTLNHNF